MKNSIFCLTVLWTLHHLFNQSANEGHYKVGSNFLLLQPSYNEEYPSANMNTSVSKFEQMEEYICI